MPSSTTSHRREGGFTLVELIAVVVVIGVLAAIAVPVFLGQREKANDSAVQSDLASLAVQMQLAYAETGRYPNASELNSSGAVVRASRNVTLTVNWITPTGFCAYGQSADGTNNRGWWFVSKTFYMVSADEGVLPLTSSHPGCMGFQGTFTPGDGSWTEAGFAPA